MGHTVERAAERAGTSAPFVTRLVDLGLVGTEDGLTDGDVRRVQIIEALERAGMSVEGVAELVRRGWLGIQFIDGAGARVFAALSDTTFEELASQSGIPIEVLVVVREAVGGRPPLAEDRMREDELELVPLIRMQLDLGFRPAAIERAVRVYGDSLRRMAETEAEWWRTEVQDPLLARGGAEADIARMAAEIGPELSDASDRAVLAMYHAQQRLAWSVNIVNGIAKAMESAGLHVRTERLPAMCFLDITGYTRLTQERGDNAAAELAERVSRIVQRTAIEHDGRPVKWLGDGVMLHFADPAQGVAAALAFVEALQAAGLPPAHVGLHAGPIIFQEGDYFGRTVNVAARIGEYARPGEVLVSADVVDVVTAADVATFVEVGPVELKGVGEAMRLFMAKRAP